MPRYHLAYPDYRPVLLAPDQPSPIGGTWRPAKYTEIGGQIHFGLACEQAGPTFNGHRCCGFRFPGGHLADVLAARVAWVDEVTE
jgi:hypothetical protein